VYARQVYKQQLGNIGQHATAERRYFDGIVGDKGHVGRLFGLDNLFSHSFDKRLLAGIIERSDVAENYALGKFQLNPESLGGAARGGDAAAAERDENGLYSLGAELAAEQGVQDPVSERGTNPENKKQTAMAASVETILLNCGVEYRHKNAEIAATNRAETLLSEHAKATYRGVELGIASGVPAKAGGLVQRSLAALRPKPENRPRSPSPLPLQAPSPASAATEPLEETEELQSFRDISDW